MGAKGIIALVWWRDNPRMDRFGDALHSRTNTDTSTSLCAEGYEARVKERLARWRAAQEKMPGLQSTKTVEDLGPAEIISIKQKIARRNS